MPTLTASQLTTVEAKSKVIAHDRLLELIGSDDVQVTKIITENNDSVMRIKIRLNHDVPLHPHFAQFKLAGYQFIGLGFLPGERKLNAWLHQWLIVTIPDILDDKEQSVIETQEVLDSIAKHKHSFESWLETSRGW